MAFTKRKENRLKAWSKYSTTLKKYSKQPVIKNVDVEELKKQFASAPATEENKAPKATKKKAETTEEAIVTEPVVAKTGTEATTAPVAE